MNDDDEIDEKDTAAALEALRARDIDRPEQFLEFASSEGILGACKWFDEQRQHRRVGTGLLVSVLREGGKPNYGQKIREVLPVTPKLLNAVRGRCLSPDGCRREDLLDMFEDAASRRGVTSADLLNLAMGPRWQLTPPHPAILRRSQWYAAWVLSDERDRPDATVVRAAGESLLAYAQRFWRVEWEVH